MVKNIIFIDSRVTGHEALLGGLDSDCSWVLLNPEEDGVLQMQRALASAAKFESIQLISHGSAGTLYFGSTVLDSSNLLSYQSQLLAIGSSLTETGDILLYGCDVAKGEDGIRFVNSLSAMSGADVAASNNLTGPAVFGWDSILEVATGSVEAATLELTGLAGSLDVIPGSGLNDTLMGTVNADTISGGVGNDNINGGDGIDVAVYSGTMSGYLIELINGQLTVRDGYAANGDDGTDRLANIEVLRFADGELTVAAPSGPVEVYPVFEVNTITAGNQWGPVVTALDNGGFTIAWQSRWLDDTFETELYPYGTYSRTYDAQGIAVGEDVRIGDYVGDPESTSSSAILNNGDRLVAWQEGYSPEWGTGYDIYAHRYAADPGPVSIEIAGTDGVDKMYGGAGSTVLRGGGGNDILKGGADHDVLYGDSGGDTLNGESGNDEVFGGAGNDIYYVESAGDKVFETLSSDGADLSDTGGNDTIRSAIAFDLDGYNGVRHVENLTLTGATHLNGYGNSLANVLDGNAGNNILFGRAGNDSLRGMDGADKLNGDSGNDILNGGAGADFLNGGAGDDTYYVENIGDRVFESVSNVSTDTADAGGVELVYSTVSMNLNAYNGVRFVENLTLTGSAAINGTGNSLANIIVGNAGGNVLDGGLGADNMSGGLGHDVYVVDNVNDLVAENAGAGIDTVNSYLTSYTLGVNIENGRISRSGTINITGNDLDNFLYAGLGSNVINGGGGIDTAFYTNTSAGVTVSLAIAGGQTTGGSSTDTLISIENLVGSNYADSLAGDAGNNILDGGEGADFLSGGAGNDTYVVTSADDVVSEASGQGTDMVLSTASTFSLAANVENARIDTAGAANLTGNSLDNIIYAGAGNNTLSGGNGIDTLSFAYGVAGATGVTVSLMLASSQATGGSGMDSVSGFEHLTGSSGNDRLTGNDGNNTLNGGLGGDILIGGLGDDIYYVDNASDVITEGSTGGLDLANINILGTYTLGNYVESGRITATGAANLNGNNSANTLYSGAANNVLDGGAGVDTISYQYAIAAVSVNLSTTAAQATGGSGNDTLLNIENLIGSLYNDSLTGSSGNNVLDGGSGNDSMAGGDGNDAYHLRQAGDTVIENFGEGTDIVNSYLGSYVLGANIEHGRISYTGTASITGNDLGNFLYAGAGNNVISGGSGADTALYLDAASGVIVSLAATGGQATGGSGTDTLVGIERLTGSNFDDILSGDAGTNVLNGGAGNDQLLGSDGGDTFIGGGGWDRLTGGAGNDIFDFNALAEMGLVADSNTWDVIAGFANGDRIDLSTLDANTTNVAGSNDAFSATLVTSFTAAGQLKFDTVAHVLYANTDADYATADLAIKLIGVGSMASADFIL